MFRCIAIAAALLAASVTAASAASSPEDALRIDVPTVAVAPKIDGTLGDAAWQGAAKVELRYDRLVHGAATEPTTVYILTDGKALYFAFDATQTKAPVITNQRSNNVGVDTDDEVKIALWPGGKSGVLYQFISTPTGTRYQYSTENSAFEPTWDSVGKVSGSRYVVTMRIPLGIMRGAQKDAWLINLTRYVVTTGSLYAWSGGDSFQGTPDQNYAKPLAGMPQSVSQRPQPRVGLYGLALAAPPAYGGNTSRAGADISVPLTNTTSFIAAIHPDFSNVEQDQQTISPTAFRRFFNETRPFFTQGAQYFNVLECDACNTEVSLYTPAIPTPRNGYAIEGKARTLTFAAFDAVGFGRLDTAQAATIRTTGQQLFVSAQHVGVYGTSPSLPGPAFRDDTWQFATKLDDLHHKFVYANYGLESATGNWITDRSQAHFGEIGAGLYGPNSFCGGGLRTTGAQYNPWDGFFTHAFDANGNPTAMNGYGLYCQHTWIPRGGVFKSIEVNGFGDSYHNPFGLSMMDFNGQIEIVTRSLWQFVQNTGASYFMINGAVVPVTQETTRVVFRPGTATPTSLVFGHGRYGPGYLHSWYRSTTMKIGQRGSLLLEADDTRQYLDDGRRNHQWLERLGYTYTIDANTSASFGVRRFFGPPPTPNGGSTCIVPQRFDPNALGYCPNVSAAFHRRLPHDELYVSYGSASTTFTVPQVLVKWIHYVGAEKGT